MVSNYYSMEFFSANEINIRNNNQEWKTHIKIALRHKRKRISAGNLESAATLS